MLIIIVASQFPLWGEPAFIFRTMPKVGITSNIPSWVLLDLSLGKTLFGAYFVDFCSKTIPNSYHMEALNLPSLSVETNLIIGRVGSPIFRTISPLAPYGTLFALLCPYNPTTCLRFLHLSVSRRVSKIFSRCPNESAFSKYAFPSRPF